MNNSNDEQTTKLQDELKKLLEQASNLTSNDVEQRFQILNTAARDLIAFHTDQIRNLGIISGVVAPFSLMLLQIENINTNFHLLLLGFVILVVNIILSQFFLHRELVTKNEKITNASIKYVFAFDSKRTMEDEKQELGNRTNGLFDYSKNLREFDKLLGLTPHDTEALKEKARLKQNSRYAISIFSVGCAFIILSIIVNPILRYLAETLQVIRS